MLMIDADAAAANPNVNREVITAHGVVTDRPTAVPLKSGWDQSDVWG